MYQSRAWSATWLSTLFLAQAHLTRADADQERRADELNTWSGRHSIVRGSVVCPKSRKFGIGGGGTQLGGDGRGGVDLQRSRRLRGRGAEESRVVAAL